MVREILYDDLFHRVNSSLSEYRRAQGDDKRKFAIHLSSLLFGRVLTSPSYRDFDAEISAKLESIVSNPAVCGVLNFRIGNAKDIRVAAVWRARKRYKAQGDTTRASSSRSTIKQSKYQSSTA